MDSYCDINNAYTNKGILHNKFDSNTSSGDLEKLARQVNNSKKSKSKDIYQQYRKGSEKLDRASQAFNTMISSQVDKGTNISPYYLNSTMGVNDVSNLSMAQNMPGVMPGVMSQCVTASDTIPNKDTRKGAKKPVNGFYSAQGNYAEFKAMGENTIDNIKDMNNMNFKYKPKNMSQSLIGNIVGSNYRKKIIDDGSDGISLDTPSNDTTPSNGATHSNGAMPTISDSNSSESSFSSMTWDTKDIDKHIKTKSIFNDKKRSNRHKCMDFDLSSVDSLESLDSGESLLRHIRFCKACKDKVMDLIRKHKTDSIKQLKNVKNNQNVLIYLIVLQTKIMRSI